MKLMKGRAMTFVALSVLLLSFIALIAVMILNNGNADGSSSGRLRRVMIDGKYSVDGGEWQDTVPGKMVHTKFSKATIKGVLSESLGENQRLVIFANNIRFRLEADGKEVLSENDAKNSGREGSPGDSITDVQTSVLKGENGETELTLTLTYPYAMFSNADLSDFFRMYLTGPSGVYKLLIEYSLASAILCLMICLFGLFAFPIAGSVLGGINVRYLAFSVLCFFTGFHLLVHVLHNYLPLWINDPVLCMSITETTGHLFGICALVFIKAILVEQKHKTIGNVILLLFTVMVIVLYVLNMTKVCDLYASKPYAQIIFTVCAAILAACMFREMKVNRDAKLAIFTLIPLGITLLYDTINMYLGFSDIMLFEMGAVITLIIQIIFLLCDLRRQYKETLRYQQIQRELYESRVAIMVSQIQPHFLYNSLTSIAMMCTIDPETAQEATVTFADYLRGNMDSLKQKTPVPFSKELEHLKKYLYIEKLRFGKKLNIVYDIQTENFVLPQLSIQPLAENAVKHGISKKRGGGTLTIATRETENSFEVIVSDDGKGFDVNEIKNDGRSHIGMDNVRRRLREMCGGEVKIESKIGEGTVATVILPKEGQNREDPVC